MTVAKRKKPPAQVAESVASSYRLVFEMISSLHLLMLRDKGVS